MDYLFPLIIVANLALSESAFFVRRDAAEARAQRNCPTRLLLRYLRRQQPGATILCQDINIRATRKVTTGTRCQYRYTCPFNNEVHTKQATCNNTKWVVEEPKCRSLSIENMILRAQQIKPNNRKIADNTARMMRRATNKAKCNLQKVCAANIGNCSLPVETLPRRYTRLNISNIMTYSAWCAICHNRHCNKQKKNLNIKVGIILI